MSNDTPSAGSTADITRRRTELSEIRSDLRENHAYLNDEDNTLWKAIAVWLQLSHDRPVGSVRTLVQTSFMALTDNPDIRMFDHEGVDEGEDGFPDACKGCPHYGVQCPILARHAGKKRLDRILSADVDDETVQRDLSELASDKHCHVLKSILDSWGDGYRQFVRLGEVLRTLASASVRDEYNDALDLTPLEPDEILEFLQIEYQTESGLKEAVRETVDGGSGTGSMLPSDGATAFDTSSAMFGDGPDPEDAHIVDNITDDLMTDDDEEDGGHA